ncbi:MAG: deoxyribodipyrimidine photo-lyase [Sulfurimonas sp.]|jgi:deoxyribodipyrimidine photo-lyase|nr:deoxyribodipyrimidine photo-lyase [Sulfurimonas sp.]
MRRILWFRLDLRVEDNPLLSLEGEVFPIFIFDRNILDKLEKNDRRVSMIFHYVLKLKEKLKELGLDLKIFYGKPQEIFNSLNLSEFDEVVASGDYDSYAKERDLEISLLIHFHYIYDTYLFKPKEVLKGDGSPYLVFTAFYNKGIPLLKGREISVYKNTSQILYNSDYTNELTLESMGFETQIFEILQDINEKIEQFKKLLPEYKINRDFLSIPATSDLSVALRFGLVSVREIYRKFVDLEGGEAFIRQLIFRDFYAYLLFHFPHLQTHNYKGKFNGIEDKEKFERFCSASTGFPIVDAGVRELLQTGKMHNRVRMVVASFFTKDLLLPWQWGEKFFAQHLLDYDAASNILSWQWSAGTGIDPQPYFRVFNPYLQSKKFDKEAVYIKKYLPVLEQIDAKYIHNEEYLLEAKIPNYPKPMVEHKVAAKIAIDYFKNGA